MQQSQVTLENSGLPVLGLGTWKINRAEVSDLLEHAARAGYRHFDCACDYGNEAEVGEALQRIFTSGLCRREEVWITSKLWNTYHKAEHVRLAAERSLSDLRLDYFDLYLIHFPISLRFVPLDVRYPPGWVYDPQAQQPRMEFAPVPVVETWRAMEQLVRDGLVRHIGVCNFNCALLRELLTVADIRPGVLQVEMHPYLSQTTLLRFCREEGIAVTAFSPLGASSYVSLQMAQPNESVLEDPVVCLIASQHHKTPAQIVLRWGVQRGTAVIPKTSRVERLQENLAIFDFELTADQMKAIDGLNRNRRFNDPGAFCEQAFGTFCPIYE